MTRSVEIPDAAVSRAADAFRDNLEYDAFGEVGDEQRFDAMRAALVAARPYLTPSREEIEEVISDSLLSYEQAVDAIMALISGASS